MYLFFEYMYTREIQNFYTVVFVNNVNIKASVRIRRYTPTEEKTLLFYKKESLFYNVHRYVFLY